MAAVPTLKGLDELARLMTSVPSSHKVGGAMYGSVTSLRGIMAALHERSAAVKDEVGQGDCPVFTSCKSLTRLPRWQRQRGSIRQRGYI